MATVTPFVGAGLLGAAMTWAGVLCYFAGCDRAALIVVGAAIPALTPIKIAVIAPP